jgi:UDP-glucuronate decarboxylase
VTGGAGFVGSHLCRRLLAEGHEVVALDNLYTGQRQNILELFSHPRFRFVEHDVERPLLLGPGIDQIYHLACPASPVHYQRNPVATVRTNVLGMLHVLEYAQENKSRVLQASTSEVYGDPTEHPQRESYWGNVSTLSLRACYDEGKRCAETLCMDYHRQYGVDVRIIRIFNTYGPRMAVNDGRVISSFILRALKNEPITINGDGSYTRSFQYVDDLVEGMVRVMHKDGDLTGPINIGNPGEFSIIELAKIVKELTGSSSEIILLPPVDHDPKQRKPDIALAKQMLDWEPRIALRDGLLKTIAYFKNEVENGRG